MYDSSWKNNMPNHNPSLKAIFETPRICVQFFLGCVTTGVFFVEIPWIVELHFHWGAYQYFLCIALQQAAMNQQHPTGIVVEIVGINQNGNLPDWLLFDCMESRICGALSFSVLHNPVLRFHTSKIVRFVAHAVWNLYVFPWGPVPTRG